VLSRRKHAVHAPQGRNGEPGGSDGRPRRSIQQFIASAGPGKAGAEKLVLGTHRSAAEDAAIPICVKG
jgi:hypothetical protein